MNRFKPVIAVLLLLGTSISTGSDAAAITDSASAVDAAKRYTKGSCNAVTPCTYKANREGKQWRVLVKLTKRKSPQGPARPYAGGDMFLFFDTNGNLIRKINAE